MKTPFETLKEERESLITRFDAGREPDLLLRHTEMLDDYFRESFSRSSVGPRMHLERNPCVFIALGGYGRKEQCLRSDVDLLVLFRKQVPDETQDLVQEILYPLWDLGLEVGYSTRSFRECLRTACQDFESLTSMSDARFLCGISSVYAEFMGEVNGRILKRQSRPFLSWHAERSRQRHERYGDSSYLLEPNLKEGLGGLRDYHVLLWVARAKYGIRAPDDLARSGHLSQDEFRTLLEALAFIWAVRNRLHHLSGRKCDQLYFEYQVRMAESMGFREEEGQQAVERFLAVLHSHMEFVKQLHLTFLNKVLPKPLRPFLAYRMRVRGLKVSREGLGFEEPDSISRSPQLLMKIFEQSGLLGLPLTLEAKRIVRESLGLVDRNFRLSPGIVPSLRRILVDSPNALGVLSEMFTTGILVTLIPELKGIVNRIQYDEYHHYPVHTHLLHTVQILKDMRTPAENSPDSLEARILGEIAGLEPLLWASLFHDVGKEGSGQDHANRGAEITRSVFQAMGFPEPDVDLISFLVREHLLLVKTATQRDIHDEKVVVQCARKFRHVDELKMLYLLTIADCKATGPKAWNDWTAVLLKELFFKIYHILEKGELATPASVEIVERKKQAVLRDGLLLSSRDAREAIFDQMSPRYLLYTPSEEILRHIELYRKLGDRPFVLEYQSLTDANYRTVTVCGRDRPGLFSKIAGVLTLNGLDILAAQIHTWGNRTALDIFRVKAPPDTLFEEERWVRVVADLQAAIEGTLSLEEALDKRLLSHRPHPRGNSGAPDSIVVDNRGSDFLTIVEVYTHDHPGLLYRLTNALYRCSLDIRVAMIATKVDQVVDIFYVRDLGGEKVEEDERLESIRMAIQAVLDGGADTPASQGDGARSVPG